MKLSSFAAPFASLCFALPSAALADKNPTSILAESAPAIAQDTLQKIMPKGSTFVTRHAQAPDNLTITGGTFFIGTKQTGPHSGVATNLFVSDNTPNRIIYVTTVVANGDKRATAFSSMSAGGDFDEQSIGAYGDSKLIAQAEQNREAAVKTFQHIADDYDTSNIQTALEKAMRNNLPDYPLEGTKDNDDGSKTMYARSCFPSGNCQQFTTTFGTDPKTRVMHVNVVASSTAHTADDPNGPRKTIETKVTMSDIRDDRSFSIPETGKIKSAGDLLTAASLGGDALRVLLDFQVARQATALNNSIESATPSSSSTKGNFIEAQLETMAHTFKDTMSKYATPCHPVKEQTPNGKGWRLVEKCNNN